MAGHVLSTDCFFSERICILQWKTDAVSRVQLTFQIVMVQTRTQYVYVCVCVCICGHV